LPITLFVVFTIALADKDRSQDCSYLDEVEKVLATDPIVAAKSAQFTSLGEFMAVGTGIAAPTPGLPSGEEWKCISETHGFTMIWAGGDVMYCEEQSALGAELEHYAAAYNSALRDLLIAKGEYHCAM